MSTLILAIYPLFSEISRRVLTMHAFATHGRNRIQNQRNTVVVPTEESVSRYNQQEKNRTGTSNMAGN